MNLAQFLTVFAVLPMLDVASQTLPQPKVEPGRHPRLFFDGSQIPVIRERAASPAGQVIVAHLKKLLADRPSIEQTTSGATRFAGLWAAGEAFEYTLSGDAGDADDAMDLVEKIVEMPVMNMPELRRGTRYMGVAIAYDLCYDAWPEDFRTKVAGWLADRADGLFTRDEGVKGDNSAAQSNHNVQGRTQMGVIALAIAGDPGAGSDAPRVIDAARKDLNGWLREGVGNAGWGTEGQAFTINCLNWGVFPFAVAYQNVIGEPVTTDPSLKGILVLLMAQVVGDLFPYYGPEVAKWQQNIGDKYGSGYLALGAEIVDPQVVPALRNFYEQHFAQGEKMFLMHNPLEAVYLLANFPWDVETKPLDGILPLAIEDKQKSFYVFRNRYENAEDLLTVAYFHSDVVSKSWRCEPSIQILGLGQKWVQFDPTRNANDKEPGGKVTDYTASPDGSGQVDVESKVGNLAFAVDYSGASGSPGVYVLSVQGEGSFDISASDQPALSAGGREFEVKSANGTFKGTLVGGNKQLKSTGKNNIRVPGESLLIMTLQEGQSPKVQAMDDQLGATLGNQAITIVNDKITLKTR